MIRGRSWRLVRCFLATCVLVAGGCPPVRFGHSHSNHGEHSHLAGVDLHEDHGGEHHEDGLAVEGRSFHWHAGLLMPGGRLPVSGDGLAGAGGCDEAMGSIAPPPTSPVLVPGPSLLAPLDITWLPPPRSPSNRIHSNPRRTPCEAAASLVGCVLIRC